MSTPIKRAFLVGINYKGTDYELGGCINDVTTIKDLLISQYGYLENNIVLLSDNTHIKPTRANILEGWRWLLSKNSSLDFAAANEDISNGTILSGDYESLTSADKPRLFFHYSGHGSQVKDMNGDEKDGKDETICPIDSDTAGMITDDVIREELASKVPSHGKLFSLIDACHSESSLDLLWTVTSCFFGSFKLSKVGNYESTKGEVVLLSGCRDSETSSDIVVDGKGQGALTYSFVEVLKASNYKITYDKLLTDIRHFIKDEKLSHQVPCLSFGKSAKISSRFTL